MNIEGGKAHLLTVLVKKTKHSWYIKISFLTFPPIILTGWLVYQTKYGSESESEGRNAYHTMPTDSSKSKTSGDN